MSNGLTYSGSVLTGTTYVLTGLTLSSLTYTTGSGYYTYNPSNSGWYISSGSNSVVIGSNVGYSYSTTLNWSGYPVLTRAQLREFCKSNIITEEIFEELQEQIPLGADLLTELAKIDIYKYSNQKYIIKLLREKKLRRILHE